MTEELKQKLIYSLEVSIGYLLIGAGIGLGIGSVFVWLLYLYDFI